MHVGAGLARHAGRERLVANALGGEMRASGSNAHAKRAAASGLALDFDRAAVSGRQLLDQRESDAGAFVRARLRAFDAMKALEQSRLFRCRNPDAAVGGRYIYKSGNPAHDKECGMTLLSLSSRKPVLEHVGISPCTRAGRARRKEPKKHGTQKFVEGL